MALTKTQISYLEEKLDRVVSEKSTAFKNEVGDTNLPKAISERLSDGSIKLLSEADIVKVIADKIPHTYTYGYHTSVEIEYLINEKDLNKLKKELDDKSEKIRDYNTKLHKAKQDALDKIVLDGVDIETALALLDSV